MGLLSTRTRTRTLEYFWLFAVLPIASERPFPESNDCMHGAWAYHVFELPIRQVSPPFPLLATACGARIQSKICVTEHSRSYLQAQDLHRPLPILATIWESTSGPVRYQRVRKGCFGKRDSTLPEVTYHCARWPVICQHKSGNNAPPEQHEQRPSSTSNWPIFSEERWSYMKVRSTWREICSCWFVLVRGPRALCLTPVQSARARGVIL